MALRTPPSTVQKANNFLDPVGRLQYFEDLYGVRNEDESFDRYADSCEDESDSDSGEIKSRKSQNHGGFFKRFAQSKGEQTIVQPKDNKTGEAKRGSDKNIITDAKQCIFGSPPSKLNQYKIAPSINPKQSVQVDRTKKLIPRKYGVFAASAMPYLNTAGEAMDDLLGTNTLDNFDDGFLTLEADEATTPGILDTHPTETSNAGYGSFADNTFAIESKEAHQQKSVKRRTPVPAFQGASDGDVEDNVSEVDDAKDAIKALRPGRKMGATRKKRTKKPAFSTTGTGRYSTRRQEQLERQKREDERPVTRGTAKSKGLKGQTGNRNKITARAPTRQKRVKKVGVRGGTNGSYGKDGLRLRNWKGELMEEEKAYVLVHTGGVNVDEFVRC